MRGDRPQLVVILGLFAGFTPHARGSTVDPVLHGRGDRVYPACAGIDPLSLTMLSAVPRLPRMRGDRPAKDIEQNGLIKFTPHARGSTCRSSAGLIWGLVYPACAGIDLA